MGLLLTHQHFKSKLLNVTDLRKPNTMQILYKAKTCTEHKRGLKIEKATFLLRSVKWIKMHKDIKQL